MMGRVSLADQVLPQRFRNAIEHLIARNGQLTKTGSRTVGKETIIARRYILLRTFAELFELGFKLQEPDSLRETHVKALVEFWLQNELGPAALQNRLCTLRMFCEWIGKSGMVRHSMSYVDDPKKISRTTVTTKSRAWDANGIDPLEVIEQATQQDIYVGLYIRLMHAFGLRLKEAICLKPLRDICNEGEWLSARDGTKGGRQRMVRIHNAYQRETLAVAQKVASLNHGKITPVRCTLEQAYSRARNQLAKLGLTKKDKGVTAHGLRHQFAQATYERLAGRPSPVRGGDPSKITAYEHKKVTMEVMDSLGHSRVDVGGNYYGSYGHALRGTPSTWVEMYPEEAERTLWKKKNE